MAQEVYISCGTGTDAYQVTLVGKDLRGFQDAIKQPQAKNKSGEELVTAILSLIPTYITTVMRKKKNGEFTDGPNGEPAIEIFERGKHVRIQHSKNGKINDGPNGEPAIQQYSGGWLVAASRYTDGVCTKIFGYDDLVAYGKQLKAAAKMKKINPALKIKFG